MNSDGQPSDKAKGKRRATFQDDDERYDALESQQTSSSNHDAVQPGLTPRADPTRTFTLRFSEGGLQDLEMTINAKDTVRGVERRIRQERPTLSRRKLRLIHSGRLLTPGTILYSWLASLEEKQERASTLSLSSTKGLLAPVFSSSSAGSEKERSNDDKNSVWIHCSVGPEIPEGELEEDHVQTAQITPLRGFDRLTTAGFSEEDIANLRRQFHTVHARREARRSHGQGGEDDDVGDGELQIGADGDRGANDEDANEHARALEEQWIDSAVGQGQNSVLDDPDDAPNIYSTLLQGILLGFFFPVLPFFFMRSPSVPGFFSSRVLSGHDRRQRRTETPNENEEEVEYGMLESPTNTIYSTRMLMAICAGFFTNIGYGVIRMLLT